MELSATSQAIATEGPLDMTPGGSGGGGGGPPSGKALPPTWADSGVTPSASTAGARLLLRCRNYRSQRHELEPTRSRGRTSKPSLSNCTG